MKMVRMKLNIYILNTEQYQFVSLPDFIPLLNVAKFSS